MEWFIMPRRTLLVAKTSPYGSVLASECLRIATAMIAMDVLPQILFIDDGVYCLLKGLKTLADLIGLYVAEHSLNQRNLKKTDLNENYNLKTVSMDEVTNLFLENETVITF